MRKSLIYFFLFILTISISHTEDLIEDLNSEGFTATVLGR